MYEIEQKLGSSNFPMANFTWFLGYAEKVLCTSEKLATRWITLSYNLANPVFVCTDLPYIFCINY